MVVFFRELHVRLVAGSSRRLPHAISPPFFPLLFFPAFLLLHPNPLPTLWMARARSLKISALSGFAAHFIIPSAILFRRPAGRCQISRYAQPQANFSVGRKHGHTSKPFRAFLSLFLCCLPPFTSRVSCLDEGLLSRCLSLYPYVLAGQNRCLFHIPPCSAHSHSPLAILEMLLRLANSSRCFTWPITQITQFRPATRAADTITIVYFTLVLSEHLHDLFPGVPIQAPSFYIDQIILGEVLRSSL